MLDKKLKSYTKNIKSSQNVDFTNYFINVTIEWE